MNNKIPTHVAIICDGNGRWAKERGLPRSMGHKEAIDNFETVVKYIFSKGVKVLSAYIFSTENFNRPKDEVDFLMNEFRRYCKKMINEVDNYDYKIIFSKKEKGLPEDLEELILKLEKITESKTGSIFNLCMNYSGQDEIVDMTIKIAEQVKNDVIKIDDIDRTLVSKNLYNDLPPVDLLIRTSGEFRLSNYMLWQLSYAELYFPKIYFPDFKEKSFDEALEIYAERDRRFGAIKEES